MKRIRIAISYIPKLLRLLVFCFVASSALAAFSVRALANTARDGMMSLGHTMMNYAEHTGMSRLRQMQLNGVTFQLATGSTEDSVSRVLDVYEQRCDAVDGQLTEQLQEALRNATPEQRQQAVPRQARTTLRVNGEQQGYVACVDMGSARVSPEEMVNRSRRFIETGDLSSFGHVRYVFAERGRQRTRVMAIWNDGEFNPGRMFPMAGDAPGQDPPNVARPRGLVRLLSAAEINEPYSLTMYTTQRSRDDVFADYNREMTDRGWRRLNLSELQSAQDVRDLQSYSRNGVNIAVVMKPMNGGGSAVTVLSSR